MATTFEPEQGKLLCRDDEEQGTRGKSAKDYNAARRSIAEKELDD
jgi:hypothetical protein